MAYDTLNLVLQVADYISKPDILAAKCCRTYTKPIYAVDLLSYGYHDILPFWLAIDCALINAYIITKT